MQKNPLLIVLRKSTGDCGPIVPNRSKLAGRERFVCPAAFEEQADRREPTF